MRLSKIYTKIGDGGSTLLAGGKRIAKDDPRLEAYGTIDELNAFLGLLRDTLRDTDARAFSDLDRCFGKIQNEMHDLGGELSTPMESLDVSRQQVVTKESIQRLEQEIDVFNEPLPPLANFVLPGGHRANALAHVCRTICRRAERHIVAMARTAPLRDEPRIYVNRLSDWLFVAGRVISARLGVHEVLWHQAGKSPVAQSTGSQATT